MEENNNVQVQQDEMSIDWMGILKKLLKRWKFIFLITFLFSVLGVTYAMVMKRTYSVTMILAPELQNRTNSSVSSIISMMGGSAMSMNSTPDALNITMFPEISSSNPFLCSLLEVPVTPFVPKKLEVQGWSGSTVSATTNIPTPIPMASASAFTSRSEIGRAHV